MINRRNSLRLDSTPVAAMSRICGGALCLLIAGTVTFAATGMTSAAGPAITKQDAIRAALFDDAALTLHLRSYLFDRSNNEGDDPAAWATGGWVGYQTGWIGDMLRFGAVAYTSQPLWAPEDRPGSLLLLPDQEGFSVLGQAYAALRYDGQLLTLGRQLVDQPEINPHDNRMAPITYEGASLGGDVGIFSYYAAFLTATKTRGSDKFENFAEAAGVDSNEPMYLGGLAFSPGGDIKTRTSLYAVPDILMSSYTDWQWSGQPDSYSFSLSGQVYCLKLELAAELPSLHWTPPVPLNTLTRCPRNRQQANGSLRLKRSERHLP